MVSLLYVSSSTRELGRDELLEILAKSRANNERLGVTGMLLYKGGNFMQVLEGPEDAVASLYNKILVDTRHRGAIVLLKEQRTERQFPEWSMGFRNLNEDDLPAVAGYRDLASDSLVSPAFAADPSRAQKLLLMFRDKM